MKILVVEDSPDLLEAISEEMRDELYAVDEARDGETASELMAVNEYDGVVLDFNIPPPDGIALLREWRGQGKSVPILMLTARSEIDDRVLGLDSGADDYLTKPFDFSELRARMRSLLRRRAKPMSPGLAAGSLTLDRARRHVEVAGQGLKLSAKEFAILEYLLSRKGAVVSRTEIQEHVWESSFDSMTNVIDVFIHRLRRKMAGKKGAPSIMTVKGVGYRLTESEG
ncbi:MAG: response regulator transcription factor [Acidobacteria bacterium]|nr:response regulator transcription factor [Acidobacteriota bacterium]